MSESSDTRDQLSDASVGAEADRMVPGESPADHAAGEAAPASGPVDFASPDAAGDFPAGVGSAATAATNDSDATPPKEDGAVSAAVPSPGGTDNPTDNTDDDPISVGDRLIPDFLRPPKRPESVEPSTEELPVRSVIPADSDIAYEVAPPQAHAHRNDGGSPTSERRDAGQDHYPTEQGDAKQPGHANGRVRQPRAKGPHGAERRANHPVNHQPATAQTLSHDTSQPRQKHVPAEAPGSLQGHAGAAAAAQPDPTRGRSRGLAIGILLAIAAIAAILAVAFGSGALSTGDESPADSSATTASSLAGAANSDNNTELSPNQVRSTLKKVGLSSSEAKKAATRAQDDKRIAQIAANADAYAREGKDVQTKLISLAIDDPEAVGFVLDWPEKYPTKEGEAYTDNVDKGTVPQLYQWDERWGYTTYSGTTFARTGCAPTALSMVYMGLTGKTDKTPYDMGQLARSDGYESPHNGTVGDFFTDDASKLGLTCQQLDIDATALQSWLKQGGVIICNVGAGDFTDGGHFIVITGMDKKGKLIIRDPYSSVRSAKHWSTNRILGQTIALYGFATTE